jgi:hypothetical protein
MFSSWALNAKIIDDPPPPDHPEYNMTGVAQRDQAVMDDKKEEYKTRKSFLKKQTRSHSSPTSTCSRSPTIFLITNVNPSQFHATLKPIPTVPSCKTTP